MDVSPRLIKALCPECGRAHLLPALVEDSPIAKKLADQLIFPELCPECCVKAEEPFPRVLITMGSVEND